MEHKAKTSIDILVIFFWLFLSFLAISSFLLFILLTISSCLTLIHIIIVYGIHANTAAPRFRKLCINFFLTNTITTGENRSENILIPTINGRNKRETHRAEENLFINKLNFTLRGKIIANKYSEKVLKREKFFVIIFAFLFSPSSSIESLEYIECTMGKFLNSILCGKLFLFVSASENEVIIIWRRVVTTNWEIMVISVRRKCATKLLQINFCVGGERTMFGGRGGNFGSTFNLLIFSVDYSQPSDPEFVNWRSFKELKLLQTQLNSLSPDCKTEKGLAPIYSLVVSITHNAGEFSLRFPQFQINYTEKNCTFFFCLFYN